MTKVTQDENNEAFVLHTFEGKLCELLSEEWCRENASMEVEQCADCSRMVHKRAAESPTPDEYPKLAVAVAMPEPQEETGWKPIPSELEKKLLVGLVLPQFITENRTYDGALCEFISPEWCDAYSSSRKHPCRSCSYDFLRDVNQEKGR